MKPHERFSFVQWALMWALMVCVLLAAVPLGANRPVSWTLLSLAVLMLFVVQVFIDSAQRLPEQTRGLWLPATLFLGAVAWSWAQLIPGPPDPYIHPVWKILDDAPGYISADPGQGRQIVMRYLCYTMIFWIAFRSAVISTRAGTMLKTVAIASTAFAAYGLYTMGTGYNPVLGENEQGPVVTATFVNRNSYATYAAFGFLANVAAYLHITSGTRTDDARWQNLLREMLERFFNGAWIYALGALLCLGALSLTQSRAGGVAGLVGLVVFVVTWKGSGRQWNPWFLLIAGGVVVFVILTSATGLTNRLLATEAENGRFLVYPEVVRAIMDRPLLGHGLGSFHDVFRQYVPAEAAVGEWVRAHNSFLENTFELGIPAATAFCSALLLITFRIYRATVTRKRNRAFSCFAFAVIATAATHSLFDFSLQIPAIAALFSVILAMGWAQSFSTADSRRNSTPQPTAKASPTSEDRVAGSTPE